MSSEKLQAGWRLNGNDDIDVASQFLGTIDATPVPFRTTDIERMRLLATGELELNPLADYVPLAIKSHSTQTSNLQEWQDSVGTNLVKIRGNGTVGVLTGVALDTGAVTFNVMDISPTPNVDTDNSTNTGINWDATWNYDIQPTTLSLFTGINSSNILTPNAALGSGSDPIVGSGIKGSLSYTANSRTLLLAQGGFFQAILEGGSGSITQAVGVAAQVIVSNTSGTITNAISGQFGAPAIFTSGTITTGITGKFIGGTQAGTNWNCQWTNDVPSFHEGKISIGHTNFPNFEIDTVKIRLRGTAGFLVMGGTGSDDATIKMKQSSSGVLLIRGFNNTNNEKLEIDFEAVANEIKFSSSSGAGIKFNMNIGFNNKQPAPQPAAYILTNVSTDRAYDANSTSVDEIADVLGTLIADLQTYGLLQ